MKFNPLAVISGPSGSGKSSIVKGLCRSGEINFHFCVSATDRSPRPGEEEGKDYHFLTPEQFRMWKSYDMFLESASYNGYHYGTLAREALRRGDEGIPLLDVDVQGHARIRERKRLKIISFFINPSMEVIKQRLEARAEKDGMSKDKIQKRLARAKEERKHVSEFDFVYPNDDLEDTIRTIHRDIKQFLTSLYHA
jgi:guanylate kinase